VKAMKQAYGAVDNFFFAKTSPANLALMRIAVGLLVLFTAILMVPDLQTLFGPDAVVTLPTVQKWYGCPHFSFLYQFPNSTEAVTFTWLALVWSSVALTFGWHTRTSAMLVLLCLASFHHRDPFAVHSGDTLLRLFSFLLIFSAAGSMYSIDASDNKSGEPPRVSIWPQRLIQLQLCGMYAQAFFCKVIGPTWQDGSALYWILKLEDYARFTLPFIPDHYWMLQICTWATLWIEFALFTLIWVRPIRPYVLAVGIALHLGIDYALNIPIFEWITMAAYLSFIDGERVEQFVASLKAKFAKPRRYIFSYQTGPSLASTTSSTASSAVEPPTRSNTLM
jgi:hypothetical protein